MTDHSRLLLEILQKHIKELANTETKYERKILKLTALLNKIQKWFPQIRNMLNFEKLCLAAGFSQEQTMVLMTGKNIEYSGELYSEEHKRKFMAKEIKAKICTDKGRFVLTIDFRPIGEWFKEQFEKLKQGYNVRQNPKQRYLKL